MNGRLNILKVIAIHAQHSFIKPLVKRKAMSKAVSVFSFHQPYPFVESLMRM